MSAPTELPHTLIQIVVILAGSRALALAARRLGQPAVAAEMIAGIALGPSLLGRLSPEAYAWLFPPASLEGVRLLSQLGLAMFMFLVGLELDLGLLRGRRHVSLAIGLTSFSVPLAVGIVVAPALHARYGGTASVAGFAVSLGVALATTALPVLARILTERNLLRSRIGTLALTSASADVVAAFIVLALVGASSHGRWLEVALGIGAALALVVAIAIVGRPLLARLAERASRGGTATMNATFVVLLSLLLASWASDRIGLPALFGAFLFGAMLPKERVLAEALTEKLETVTVVLFLPLFFALSGLRTDLALLDDPADWLVVALLAALATATKLGASALAARASRLPWRDAAALGVLLNTRGLMGLIVVNVGLELGLLSPTLFTMLVLVALTSTLTTMPLLRSFYPSRDALEEPPSIVAPASAARADVPRDAVLAYVSDARTGPALASIAHALVGERSSPARVLALHLDEPTSDAALDDDDGAPPSLVPFLERARSLSLTARTLAFVSTSPAEDIVRVADAKRASLILVGAHEPPSREDPLGGVVRDVLRRADCDVAVLVGAHDAPWEHGLGRVLVRARGEDDDALALGGRIAETPGVRVEIDRADDPASLGTDDLLASGRYDLAVVSDPDEFASSDASCPILVVRRGNAERGAQ